MMMTTSTSAVQAENKLELKISMSLTYSMLVVITHAITMVQMIKVLHSMQKMKIVVNIVLSKFINNCIDTIYSFSNPFEI